MATLTTMSKLSIIILAGNAADEIAPAFATSQFADEIIWVNTGSSDNTAQIARKYQARVVHSSGTSFAKWRNDGAKVASGDWLLYLDSDERIPVKLAKEIREKIETTEHNAFTISRFEVFLGKHLSHWPDPRVLRLLRRSTFLKWEGKLHEQPKFRGSVGDLHHQMVHLAHRNIDDKVQSTLKWSRLEAQMLLDANHPPMAGWRFVRIMLTEFWDRCIRQGLWRDGTEGWIEIIYQMFSKFLTYERLWEAQRSPSLDDAYQNIDKQVLTEWKESGL